MATVVPMPKLGNTVESTILLRWHCAIGEAVRIGQTLCEVETDKAVMEVESPASGTILALYFQAGDEVPVMAAIAVIGDPDEKADELAAPAPSSVPVIAPPLAAKPGNGAPKPEEDFRTRISPRARRLAEDSGINPETLEGTGPDGRIIERDIQNALTPAAKLTPVARSMVEKGDFVPPEQGTGPGGRIGKRDLIPKEPADTPQLLLTGEQDIEVIPLRGARKVIAARMLDSLQTTAQLTLNASADARALQAYRKRLKDSAPDLNLQNITVNDLLLFAVSRTLPHFPDLNSLFMSDAVHRYKAVHLGVAVDTPRGLLVPVIRNANTLSLKALADEAHQLAQACQESRITPDEMSGGTFSVTNLGSLGIESFTPVLNPPQVAILGIGAMQLKPVETDGDVIFIPHIALSLTINHQVVDGAPGARFLQALSKNLAQLELLLAL
jgi:pyruvate dehydrogenase E2 component (dihydrolipoamide acetyltransferase)